IAAIFAGDRTRHVEPAQLLDGVIEHSSAENVVPGFGEEPETSRHVRADRGALRPRRAFALAAFHLGAHPRVHIFERDVTDSLLCHLSCLSFQRGVIPLPRYSWPAC